MNRILILLVFCCSAFMMRAQVCPNYNQPVSIADSCHKAPFLCGNFLDNYCSSNFDMTEDSFGLASGFLRFSTCFEEMSIEISVHDCNPGSNALIFTLFDTMCNPQATAIVADTIENSTVDTLSASNLTSLEPYLLAISGLQNSQCAFTIKVLEGIGTALPGPVTCFCTAGILQGPKSLCSYAPVIYTFIPPVCDYSFGAPVGGNGEYCPPASVCPNVFDSIAIDWILPPIFHFDGDSTGLTISIALDTSYHGLDTVRIDTLMLIYRHLSSTPIDSLSYCDCAGFGCEDETIYLFYITTGPPVYANYSCELSCADTVCVINGISYTMPGIYTYPGTCVDTVVVITQKDEIPIVNNQFICEGETAVLTVINYDPAFKYTWSNGATGQSISVSPNASTLYTVTAVHEYGECVFTTTAAVIVNNIWLEDLGQIGTISCEDPCVFYLNNTYCDPGQYSVQVANCHIQTFTIGFDPSTEQIQQPTVTICQGQCFDFFGTQICSSQTAMHTVNCTTYTRQIIVEPRDTVFEGIVGAVTCDNPCFTYNGISYCDPGQYKVESECVTTFFDIAYKKVEIDLGTVDTINCKKPCVTFDLETYCNGGSYEKEDSCYIRKFVIFEDERKPEVTKPVLDCAPTNTHFTVAFEIYGLPPFKVGEEELAGNFFLSDPVINGSNYAFIVKHDNGCEITVSGYYDCAQFCASDPGLLSGEVVHGCAGQTNIAVVTIQLPNLAPGDVLVYQLQDADGLVVASNDSGTFAFDPVTMEPEVTYLASCVVGPPDVNGLPNPTDECTDTSSTQPVIFHQTPTVSIEGDSSLCEFDPIALLASGATSYLWNTGATSALLVIPEATPANSGWYKVRGTAEYGCFADDSTFIEVFPSDSKNCCKPQIPTAFTPNGDGANDSFVPLISDCTPLEYAEMRIYSRWGQLVFRSDKDQMRWDGTYDGGQPAGSDTYVFSFRYKLLGEMEKTESGEITLLR
ncbi:MAG TPA: gliding motility-associated C-terminal domain-containing protein [Saprospiraceae bacterium]|nr:gliding motility-associated C-terminal domain-containing protein [Saprospiraceae bacterium]